MYFKAPLLLLITISARRISRYLVAEKIKIKLLYLFYTLYITLFVSYKKFSWTFQKLPKTTLPTYKNYLN